MLFRFRLYEFLIFSPCIGPLVHVIPAAFPPPAVVLEEGRVSSSNLVVIKAVESLAKEILATVPAMDQVCTFSTPRTFRTRMWTQI
jgi:hypothetical protein